MNRQRRAKLLVMALAVLCTACLLAEGDQDEVTIEFTEVPPPGVGPDSRGSIAGIVRGLSTPETYKVVLYAHTDQWYVQPLTDHPYTEIANDGHWNNWTHLGQRYAALAVVPSFQPPRRLQSLPRVGGEVIAKSEVPAKAK